MAKIPDAFLLNIPNLEKGKNITKEEYVKQLNFYIESLQNNPNAFYKDTQSIECPDIQKLEEFQKNNIKESLYTFPSNYSAFNPEIQKDIDQFTKNKNAYIKLWHSDFSKPLVLCIHGLKMGGISTSYRMFKIKSLLKKGVNVALMIQPYHGLRSEKWYMQYFLNPGNIPLSIEASRQAVFDGIKTMLVLKKLGYYKIGVVGASLGGFTTLNLAINSNLQEFCFASQPAITFENHLNIKKSNMPFQQNMELQMLMNKAMDITSPLNYIPKLPTEKIGIVYHKQDLITPANKIEALISQWEIKYASSIEGGHWLYFDKGKTRGKSWYTWLSNFGFIDKK